jgi:AcrR family transcriptional regulator
MTEVRSGRPRDAQLHQQILQTTRELLASGSYAELSMESVAARAGVGKKTLYRRWSSKAPLVAEAVLSDYWRGDSFRVADTGDVRADLGSWIDEHAEFIAAPPNAALIRAVIAAASASTSDFAALSEQLGAPQYDGLMARLRRAVEDKQIRSDADLDAIANALIGTLLMYTLNLTVTRSEGKARFDGLLDAILNGVAT